MILDRDYFACSLSQMFGIVSLFELMMANNSLTLQIGNVFVFM